MSCKDCPPIVPPKPPVPRTPVPILPMHIASPQIFTDGSPGAIQAALKHLAPDVTVHPDGRLEFPNEPGQLTGYSAAGQILQSHWVNCLWRLIILSRPDALQLKAKCLLDLQDIIPKQCESCTNKKVPPH